MSTDEKAERNLRENEDEEDSPSRPGLPPHLANPTPATPSPHAPAPPTPGGPVVTRLIPGAGKGNPTFGSGAPVPSSQLDATGRPQVDKYFGSRLPPVCRQLGCYVTDDAKFYYCINPHCHKDRKRETKYNRRRKSLVYFFCPKCKSREIQLHLRNNQYECLECAYSWRN